MKKLIKDSKKRGLQGRFAKHRLKTVMLAFSALVVMGVLMFSAGIEAGASVAGIFGVIGGGALVALPLASFVIPEDVKKSLDEDEAKGLQLLGEVLTKALNENLEKGAKEATEKMQEALKAWGTDNGISKEKMDKLENALKVQGEALTSLKEKTATPAPQFAGLRKAFEEKFDDLKKAISESKVGFTIKLDPPVETTTNAITTPITGLTLAEKVGENPIIFPRRQGLQYIHDIAKVTSVGDVPEVFNFYEEGDEEGAVAIVEEGTLKPRVHLSLIENQVKRKKAAAHIVVTEELMISRPRTWSAIQRLFGEKVQREYENILTAQLEASATPYVSTPLDGTITNPTDLDAVIAAILQGELLNFNFDTLIINPADKWRIATLQTNGGQPIFPFVSAKGSTGLDLLGLTVITTTKIPSGTFEVGQSSTWYIEEGNVQLRTGLVDKDLILNQQTIVGEIYFLSYVPSNNAGSFVKDTFANIKEALVGATPAA